MSKVWKITISIIASILVLIMGFLGVYYLWPWNRDFFDNAKKEWEIPGLETTFTPQGITKLQSQDKFLISGYMNDDSPSRFYIVDNETGRAERYFILSVNEKDFIGEVGGIVSSGGSIWVVSEGYCYRFTLNDVNKVENGNKIYCRGFFKTEYNNADFVFAKDGVLYIGETYIEGDSETHENNHIQTRSGETNSAIVLGYAIDETKNIGIVDDFPIKALSIRGLCQGMDMTSDGKFVLYTSSTLTVFLDWVS